ncbi:hypothetical protein GX51_02249 [Blastomyces parvus]|uniref:DUF1275 domain-containing protein n=1 Tax=Blastomyces parvus TaxID=2060905 RepID=A0A2B7XD13_9EURO|nr:hypothetical protein GX51_02249 [Blastomyces parvus]
MSGPPSINPSRTLPSRLKTHLARNVTKAYADLILILSCFISGIVDSAAFNVWGCFVSMQTGNTIYLGLGVSGQPDSQPYRWVLSGTAILSFAWGVFVFSRITRLAGPLRRGTMATTFLVQALLNIASGALVEAGIVPPDASDKLPSSGIVLLPLALMSFQSAGQIVASRMLDYAELPTVALTSTYCDLMIDPMLFTAPLLENPKRNRRFVSVVALVVGAALGGYLTRAGSIAGALWIAASIKIAIAAAWMFWKPDEGSIRL